MEEGSVTQFGRKSEESYLVIQTSCTPIKTDQRVLWDPCSHETFGGSSRCEDIYSSLTWRVATLDMSVTTSSAGWCLRSDIALSGQSDTVNNDRMMSRAVSGRPVCTVMTGDVVAQSHNNMSTAHHQDFYTTPTFHKWITVYRRPLIADTIYHALCFLRF